MDIARNNRGGRRFRRGILAASLASSLAFAGLLNTQLLPSAGAANELFGDPTGRAQATATTNAPTTMRSRQVSVHFDRLPSKSEALTKSGAQVKELTLNLFQDTTVTVDVESIEPAPGINGVVVKGKVRGGAAGVENSALIVTNEQDGDKVIYAMVQPDKGAQYEVKFAGNGVHEIRQIDPTRYPGEDKDTIIPAPSSAPAAAPDGGNQDTGSNVDVAVIWTQGAETQAGGSAAMGAKVLSMITDSNTGYANSGATIRVRLVHMRKVSYTEVDTGNDINDYTTDLNRLNATADGFIDEAHTIRNNYGADYLQLLRRSGSVATLCGIANLNDPLSAGSGAFAFAVSDESCSPGNHTFPHEFGHAMGIHHNVENDPSGTTIAHGYCAPTGSPGYRTIMGVQSSCPPAAATRVNQWSNPSVIFQGVASGNASADAQTALDNNLSVAQNFRQSVTAPRAATGGVFRPSNGLIFLKDTNVTGVADNQIVFGIPNDIPVAGDFNADGAATVGVYRGGTFFLRNTNSTGFADIQTTFGVPGDLPLVGDWDNNGTDTIGLYRNGLFLLSNSNTSPAVNFQFALGQAGDIPISGDWDGNNFDTVGVFRPSNGLIFLKNTLSTGVADIQITFGIPNDKPTAGDWNGDGIDTIGVYRDGLFLLRNSNTTGVADAQYALGVAGDVPIVGDWDNLPFP